MKFSVSLGVTCILCNLWVNLSHAQSSTPVVNVMLSDYPNNIVRIPQYKSNGTINVQLSEVAQSKVEVTCTANISLIAFVKTATILVGRRDGIVEFMVIFPGRIVKFHCSGQSASGMQFQTATSAGTPGYIQVTKRPTVSLCSDVIVIPKESTLNGSVNVLFSENVTTDPVNVNCSVQSPVKVHSSPMVIKFFEKSVPINTKTTKVLYQLIKKGDAVVVSCRASSQTTSTPDKNLQYVSKHSEGNSAIFTFEVPHATFIPASIKSLGQTTISRTVSYLVLEKPATGETVFQCSLMSHGASLKPTCSGTRQPTSIGLKSVLVNLGTTNMTFEVGDVYKPLVIQVNGTTTERDQLLVDVTCCRKNADPKYYELATTMSLWVDVFPSVQFAWENITDVLTATSFSQFDPLCPCDLKSTRCDVGCCCDQDCTTLEKKAFPCISGYYGGASKEAGFEYGCQATAPDSRNYLALLCVITDNNPLLGMLYEFSSSPAADSVQFEALKKKAKDPTYDYQEIEERSLVEDDVITSGYRDGIIVKTNTGFLTIPQGIASGACAQYSPVVFLRNSDIWCSSEFSETMCSETSLWSALGYLVPRHPTQSYCATSPQVLSVNSLDNSTEVPTHVAYYCTNDTSTFIAAVQEDWGSDNLKRSLFEAVDDFVKISRCSFDDDVTAAPAPLFDAIAGTCHNVVLKVEYTLYWRGVEIVQVRAKVTMGDVNKMTSVGKLFVGQRFSVKFVYLKDVDQSQVPFVEVDLNTRSGNPGYLIGSRVLTKMNESDAVISINETWGELGLWSASSSGLCSGAKTSQVSFGVNSLSGCLVKLSLKDMVNCSELRDTILKNQEKLVKAKYIARRGNVVLNNTDDWLPLLRAPSPLTNNSLNETFGSCDDIPASLNYEILIKDVGKVQSVNQMEIIGARFMYTLHSWSFQCIGHNCKNCNITNTSNTTCSDSLQSFEVISSVVFVPVLEVTRQKRSADTSNICYQDSCVVELLYPLTISYDGERREVAIAYGLILVSMLLFVLSLTTSCVHNIRQFIFQ